MSPVLLIELPPLNHWNTNQSIPALSDHWHGTEEFVLHVSPLGYWDLINLDLLIAN